MRARAVILFLVSGLFSRELYRNTTGFILRSWRSGGSTPRGALPGGHALSPRAREGLPRARALEVRTCLLQRVLVDRGSPRRLARTGRGGGRGHRERLGSRSVRAGARGAVDVGVHLGAEALALVHEPLEVRVHLGDGAAARASVPVDDERMICRRQSPRQRQGGQVRGSKMHDEAGAGRRRQT